MKVLNIGSGPPTIPIPPYYTGWDVVRLDTEAKNCPDLLMDAMNLCDLDENQFDAVYGSHILEHIYPAVLPRFLEGVHHVLKIDGYAEFRVPDGLAACRVAAEENNLNAYCYTSPAGPIMAWDILYGWLPFQYRFGEAMAHHSAYSTKSLGELLHRHGFSWVYSNTARFEICAIACYQKLDDAAKKRLGMPE